MVVMFNAIVGLFLLNPASAQSTVCRPGTGEKGVACVPCNPGPYGLVCIPNDNLGLIKEDQQSDFLVAGYVVMFLSGVAIFVNSNAVLNKLNFNK